MIWAALLTLWVRRPGEIAADWLLPVFLTTAVAGAWLGALSIGLVIVRRLFLHADTERPTRRSAIVVGAAVLGALSSIPVDRDWDDGCNLHSGTVPAIAVPLTLDHAGKHVPAYRDSATLVECF